jgi:hypothetical protein
MFFFLSGLREHLSSSLSSFNQTVYFILRLKSFVRIIYSTSKILIRSIFDSALSINHLRGQLRGLPAYSPPLSLSKNSFKFSKNLATTKARLRLLLARFVFFIAGVKVLVPPFVLVGNSLF